MYHGLVYIPPPQPPSAFEGIPVLGDALGDLGEIVTKGRLRRAEKYIAKWRAKKRKARKGTQAWKKADRKLRYWIKQLRQMKAALAKRAGRRRKRGKGPTKRQARLMRQARGTSRRVFKKGAERKAKAKAKRTMSTFGAKFRGALISALTADPSRTPSYARAIQYVAGQPPITLSVKGRSPTRGQIAILVKEFSKPKAAKAIAAALSRGPKQQILTVDTHLLGLTPMAVAAVLTGTAAAEAVTTEDEIVEAADAGVSSVPGTEDTWGTGGGYVSTYPDLPSDVTETLTPEDEVTDLVLTEDGSYDVAAEEDEGIVARATGWAQENPIMAGLLLVGVGYGGYRVYKSRK